MKKIWGFSGIFSYHRLRIGAKRVQQAQDEFVVRRVLEQWCHSPPYSIPESIKVNWRKADI